VPAEAAAAAAKAGCVDPKPCGCCCWVGRRCKGEGGKAVWSGGRGSSSKAGCVNPKPCGCCCWVGRRGSREKGGRRYAAVVAAEAGEAEVAAGEAEAAG
jgi:hypothetical protein